MKRIGVFGASFNPPTLGHLDVINQSLHHFDEILLVPSLFHPFRKSLAPIEHRLAMLELFLKNWQCNDKGCKVSIFNIEAKMVAADPTLPFIYTYDVLVALEKYYEMSDETVRLRFIIGPDNAAPEVWQKFYRYKDIQNKWPLFIVQEKVSIHSTMVKEIIIKSTNHIELREKLIPLVGKDIATYILQHQLYLPAKRERAYG